MAVYSFLLCVKYTQNKLKLKIPKFVVYEMIKKIDKRSFIVKLEFQPTSKRKRRYTEEDSDSESGSLLGESEVEYDNEEENDSYEKDY